MIDKRSIITQKICMTLIQHNADQETIDAVRTQLEVELAKCEVYERCTELTTIDTSPLHYLQQYLDVKRIEGKSKKTIERYRYEITKMLWHFHKPLKDYTANDIRVYLDYRKNSGKKPLSSRTIENMRKVYGPFFTWLTAEGIILRNPCLAVHQIKYRKNIRKGFSKTEIQLLREACKTPRDIAIIEWMASTGCRVGEVATTQLSMIDWGELSCTVIGKGDKERKVYFDTVTAMYLQRYLATRNDQVDALFLGRSGKPISISGIQQAVKRIGKQAGIQDVHCHRFRHTLASNLVVKMPITEVATILGHNSITTTQGYCHSDTTSVMADYRKATA